MNPTQRQALLAEYGEVCNNFRALTDIRFKLLAFLPIVTGAAVVFQNDTAKAKGFALPFFGLVVTLALFTYHQRNNQLYNELVSRASEIERCLRLPEGGFATRIKPWLTIRVLKCKWQVNHSFSINLVYISSITLWLYCIFIFFIETGRQIWVSLELPSLVVEQPMRWIGLWPVVLAICVVAVGACFISKQKKNKEKEMRACAFIAANIASESQTSIKALEGNEYFLRICEKLGSVKLKTLKHKIEFYSQFESRYDLWHYIPLSGKAIQGSHLVALLTGLPPNWIFSCYNNKNGLVDRKKVEELCENRKDLLDLIHKLD